MIVNLELKDGRTADVDLTQYNPAMELWVNSNAKYPASAIWIKREGKWHTQKTPTAPAGEPPPVDPHIEAIEKREKKKKEFKDKLIAQSMLAPSPNMPLTMADIKRREKWINEFDSEETRKEIDEITKEVKGEYLKNVIKNIAGSLAKVPVSAPETVIGLVEMPYEIARTAIIDLQRQGGLLDEGSLMGEMARPQRAGEPPVYTERGKELKPREELIKAAKEKYEYEASLGDYAKFMALDMADMLFRDAYTGEWSADVLSNTTKRMKKDPVTWALNLLMIGGMATKGLKRVRGSKIPTRAREKLADKTTARARIMEKIEARRGRPTTEAKKRAENLEAAILDEFNAIPENVQKTIKEMSDILERDAEFNIWRSELEQKIADMTVGEIGEKPKKLGAGWMAESPKDVEMLAANLSKLVKKEPEFFELGTKITEKAYKDAIPEDMIAPKKELPEVPEYSQFIEEGMPEYIKPEKTQAEIIAEMKAAPESGPMIEVPEIGGLESRVKLQYQKPTVLSKPYRAEKVKAQRAFEKMKRIEIQEAAQKAARPEGRPRTEMGRKQAKQRLNDIRNIQNAIAYGDESYSIKQTGSYRFPEGTEMYMAGITTDMAKAAFNSIKAPARAASKRIFNEIKKDAKGFSDWYQKTALAHKGKKAAETWQDGYGKFISDMLIELPSDWLVTKAMENSRTGNFVRWFLADSDLIPVEMLDMFKEKEFEIISKYEHLEEILTDIKNADAGYILNEIYEGRAKPDTPELKSLVEKINEYQRAMGKSAEEMGLITKEAANRPATYIATLYDMYESPTFFGELLSRRINHSLRLKYHRFMKKKDVLPEAEIIEFKKDIKAMISKVRRDKNMTYGEKQSMIDTLQRKANSFISEEFRAAHLIPDLGYRLAVGDMQVINDVATMRMMNNIYQTRGLVLENIANKLVDGEQYGQFKTNWTIEKLRESINPRFKDSDVSMLKQAIKTNAPANEIAGLEQTIRRRQRVLDYIDDALETGYWKKLPDNKHYGSLAGKHVPAYVWDSVKLQAEGMPMAYHYMQTLIRPWKIFKTALNPGTHIRNMSWNLYAMWMADVSPLDFEAVEMAIRALRDPKSPEAIKFKELRQNFAGGQSSFSKAEMMNELGHRLKSVQKEKANKNGTLFSAAADYVRKGYDVGGKGKLKATELYAAEETLAKMTVAIRHQLRGKTPIEAINIAEKYLFNYSDISRALKWYRAMPGGAPFATFWAKFYPMIAETAIKKPWKMIPMFMFPKLMEAIASGVYGKENVAEAKKHLVPWAQNGLLGLKSAPQVKVKDLWTAITTGQKVDSKNITFIDLTSLNPTASLETGRSGIGSELPIVNWFLSNPLAPGQDPVMGILGDIQRNRKRYNNQEVWPETASGWEKYKYLADYLQKQILPSLTPGIPYVTEGGYAYHKLMAAAKKEEDYYGRQYNFLGALLDTLAYKTYPITEEVYESNERYLIAKLRRLRGELSYMRDKKKGISDWKREREIVRIERMIEKVEKKLEE
ncbi:MAG: hypothetical protein DRJ03_02760 [Chloroflexi bacterium]|nr:MAG: hypothetical protein DRJ03_02760 [Chloroflexota bacterium]